MKLNKTSNSKVVFFTEKAKGLGGQELQALEQMVALKDRHYKVLLFCNSESGSATSAKDLGLDVIHLEFVNGFYLKTSLKFAKYIQMYQPIAIMAHGSHDAILSVYGIWFAKFFYGVRKIKIFRIKSYQHGRPFFFHYNVFFSKTLVCSEYMKLKYTQNSAIKASRIEVLYPGIDFQKLESSSGKLSGELACWIDNSTGSIITQIAMLRGEKGHEVMLNAMVLIKQKVPNIRYVIVGDGSNRQLLEKLVAELDLLQHVFFTGYLKSIKPILEISTIIIQPSVYEPLGMAQIEALYMGVPVIASRVGGIPETISHEETGILVEPNNIAELASAVLNTLENLDLAKQRSQKGREFVTNRFSLASNISRLQELIEEDH